MSYQMAYNRPRAEDYEDDEVQAVDLSQVDTPQSRLDGLIAEHLAPDETGLSYVNAEPPFDQGANEWKNLDRMAMTGAAVAAVERVRDLDFNGLEGNANHGQQIAEGMVAEARSAFEGAVERMQEQGVEWMLQDVDRLVESRAVEYAQAVASDFKVDADVMHDRVVEQLANLEDWDLREGPQRDLAVEAWTDQVARYGEWVVESYAAKGMAEDKVAELREAAAEFRQEMRGMAEEVIALTDLSQRHDGAMFFDRDQERLVALVERVAESNRDWGARLEQAASELETA